MNSEGLKSLGHHIGDRGGINQITVWSQTDYPWQGSCFSCYSKSLCEPVINILPRNDLSYAKWEIDLKGKGQKGQIMC
jgi:hypothetical protein